MSYKSIDVTSLILLVGGSGVLLNNEVNDARLVNNPFRNICSLRLFPSYSFSLVILKPLDFENRDFSSVSDILI